MTAANAETIFETVLRPYRSLSPRGFSLLMLVFAGATFVIGFAFWLMGAWPVVGFCGLDIFLLQLAFRMNYRASRAAEVIRLTRDELSIRQIAANGRERETDFNPFWARVEVDRHPEIGVTGVRVASHGRRLTVASFLGPRQREAFASEFQAALASARAPGG